MPRRGCQTLSQNTFQEIRASSQVKFSNLIWSGRVLLPDWVNLWGKGRAFFLSFFFFSRKVWPGSERAALLSLCFSYYSASVPQR